MRKILIMIMLGIAFILPSGYAEKIEDFEGIPELTVYQGDQRGGVFEIEKAPEPRGLSGKASWKDDHFKHNQYTFKNPLKIPETKNELKGVLSVYVYSPKVQEVKINLILINAKHKNFQWNKRILLKKGWQKLAYDLAPDNFTDVWGKRDNDTDNSDKIDMPVYLYAFALEYDRKSIGKGEVYFDDIEYISASDKTINSTQVIYKFDGAENWREVNKRDKNFSITQQKDCLVLSRKPQSEKGIYELACRKMNLIPVGDLNKMELSLKYHGEVAARVSVKLSDSDRKTYCTLFKEVRQGENTLVWSLPTELSNEKRIPKPPLNIKSIVVSFSSAAEESTMKLLSFKGILRCTPMECIDIDVITGNPIHILKKGEEKNFALKISNSADRALSFKLDLLPEDFFGKNALITKNFVIPAGASEVWNTPFIPQKYGIWWLNFTLTESGEKGEIHKRSSFVYMEPAGPTTGKPSGFLFSICTHSERWGEKDQESEVLAAAMCGAKVIRTGVTWNGLEPEKRVWDWRTMDRLVKLYSESGMEIQYIFAYTPKWANSKGPSNWSNVPEEEAWRNYVSTFTKRYNGKIRFLEVWNEPDMSYFFKGNPDDYINILKIAYQEIKNVNPDLKVMTGGFGTLRYHPGKKYPDMQEKVIENAQEYFDVHAYHLYNTFGVSWQEMDIQLSKIRKKLRTPKPLYINESGIASINDSQRMQAEALFKKLIFTFARGAMGFAWYDLRNDGFDPADGEQNYGLMTNDFYPKAAYPVYNTLALNFGDKKFIKQYNIGINRYAFLFGNENEQIVVCWNEENNEADEHIAIRTDAKSVYSADLMGNKKIIPLSSGMTILKLSTIPSFTVLVDSKKSPEIVGNLISIAEKENITANKKCRLELQFLNPFSDDIVYELNWDAAEGLRIEDVPSRLTVHPHEKSMLGLNIFTTDEKDFARARKLHVKLSYKIKDLEWQGNILILLETAQLISAQGGKDKPPDFVLENKGNVFNFAENNPGTTHLLWQGINDLSARIWLTRKDESINVRLVVKDDVFCQQWTSGAIWKGDSVQMSLQVPGQQGFWELGFARLSNGESEVFNWLKPCGFVDPCARIGLKTEKINDGLIYDITLPMKDLGINEDVLRKGIRFNIIVNDNDGEAREGWIQIAPGTGHSKSPELFPFIIFE